MRVVTVASAYRPEERSHVAASLATTLVQMNLRVVLVDLDSAGRATRQALGSQRGPASDAVGLPLDVVRAANLVPLQLDLFRGRLFVRSAKLLVLPSRPDLRRLEDDALDAVEQRLRKLVAALPAKLELAIIDASQAPSKLCFAAARVSHVVLVPVRAGRGCEAEVLSAIGVFRRAGVASQLAFVLTATGVANHAAEDLEPVIERLTEQLTEQRAGLLLSSRLQHDIAVLGAHGVEESTREDWIDLSAELLAELRAST